MRLDPEVLKAAKRKASADNRSLTNYIETLVKRDLLGGIDAAALEVIAPPGIRSSVPVPIPGETKEERKRRDEVFSVLLRAASR